MAKFYSAAALTPMIEITCVDSSGNSELIEVDRFTIMRRYDLKLLDYPSSILGREKAIIVGLEQIRCIITCDEVLLLSRVLEYAANLQRKLRADDDTPFEFRALEVALETECTFLD